MALLRRQLATALRSVFRALSLRRRCAELTSWLLVLVPLLCLPCLLIEPSQPAIGRTAYSISIMGVYWAFEVLPIAVTALLPLVLFPLLRVMPASEVAINYFKDTVRAHA
jgi:sodium-dependent dicarboxylate transporter 2/3/5